jgi:UDP:flavonoid glycosyltransferase YjiC (YdhE family)
MHVTFITQGVRGEVQPMLALAVGMKNAGVGVRFCAHSYFQPFVEEYQIPFFPLGGNNPQDVHGADHSRKRKSRIATLLHVLRRPTELGRAELDRLWEACQGTDAVVFQPMAGTVYHAVERLRLPCCVTWLHPQYPTRFLPSPVGLPPLPLGKTYNLFTHAFMQALFWLPCRSWVNRWRMEVLGLQPVSLWGPLRLMRARRIPMLFGFTPQLVPRPKDWPEWMHITGYWFLPRRRDWTPPKDLVEFIEAGSLPLAIGFGSIIDPAAEELLRNILEALSITGQRAVLVSGWNRYRGSLPKNVFLVDSVPYDWLFPRVSAAIHAAGAGTVGEALRTGIPSVCIPFAGEQKFYARRLAELGVAPAPIYRQQVDTPRLVQAITTVTTSAAMRDRAKEFGSRIQREDGVAEAVRLLQHYLQRGSVTDTTLATCSQ